MPLVDTINSRLYMAKASLNKEIAELYIRKDKEAAVAFMNQKVQRILVENPAEIEPVKVPFYRSIFFE